MNFRTRVNVPRLNITLTTSNHSFLKPVINVTHTKISIQLLNIKITLIIHMNMSCACVWWREKVCYIFFIWSYRNFCWINYLTFHVSTQFTCILGGASTHRHKHYLLLYSRVWNVKLFLLFRIVLQVIFHLAVISFYINFPYILSSFYFIFIV